MGFSYAAWRHGGWYVQDVRYPSGACGCVSRNFPDRKWRIVCDPRSGDHTYPNRDAAAAAELALARSLVVLDECGCAASVDGSALAPCWRHNNAHVDVLLCQVAS